MLTFDEPPRLPFSCVSDETQAIVRAYSAICAPGFFAGFNTLLPKPQSRDGLDALQSSPASPEGHSQEGVCMLERGLNSIPSKSSQTAWPCQSEST